MNVEELGSVYEGLLEMQPLFKTSVDKQFTLGDSGKRKETGSYYTNDGLVRALITSALETSTSGVNRKIQLVCAGAIRSFTDSLRRSRHGWSTGAPTRPARCCGGRAG